MATKQVVTINLMHTCPQTTGFTPHVGGPITGPGCAGVKINGVPVSVLGDQCVCNAGGPDTIIEGCPGVIVNGKPIVVQDCKTAHGGTIPAGIPGVTISSVNNSVMDITNNNEPAIYNLQWLREECVMREYKVLKKITLGADTRNIADGESVKIKIYRKLEPNAQKGADADKEAVTELTGTVKNNRVEVEWEVEDYEDTENNKNK